MSGAGDAEDRVARGEERAGPLGDVLARAMTRISAKIEAEYRSRARKAVAAAAGRAEFNDATPPVDPAGLWDPAEWDETLVEAESLLGSAVVDEMKVVGVVGQIRQPFVQSVVRGHLAQIEGYGDAARKYVGATLDRALKDGLSIPQTAALLREGPFSANSARLVAQTEMIGASNGGARMAYMASARPGDKFLWLAARDDRTRPTHVAANGQAVDINQPFQVGGEQCMYPAEPVLSAAQRLNCRCSFYLEAKEMRLGRIQVPVDDLTEQFQNSAMRHMRNGKFTPERQALHDHIVRQHIQGIPRSDNPKFTMTGGGSATGKGTVLDSGQVAVGRSGSFVKVDSDEIKRMLPDADEMIARGDDTWAAFLHEESSYLAKRVMAASRENQLDYLLDGTGDGSAASVLKKIGDARKAGYRVDGTYVTIPVDEALARSYQRGLETGRFVPDEVIIGTHKGVSTVWGDVFEGFDYAELVDNTDGIKIIAKVRRGEIEIIDQDMYDAFLAKARYGDADALNVPGVTMPSFSLDDSLYDTMVSIGRRTDPPDGRELTVLRSHESTNLEWAETLTDAQRQAIEQYAGRSYFDMNKALIDSGGDPSSVVGSLGNEVREMFDAIEAHPLRSEPITVYRGMARNRDWGDALADFSSYGQGDEVVMTSFTSTSLQETVAWTFGSKRDGFVMEITTRKGANVMDMAMGPREAEVILNPGTVLRVVAPYDEATGVIKLEVL